MQSFPEDPSSEHELTTQYTSMPSFRYGNWDEEWALIRYVGEPIGEVIPIGSQGIRIGRSSESDLNLPEAEVSRHHAHLSLSPDGKGGHVVQITDLGSTNGSFVNGRRIEKSKDPMTLRNGDVVRVGSHAFKLKQLDEFERHYHEVMLIQTSLDPLTGVNNRSSILNFLEKHADLARRYRRPLSIVLADLDHFKEVNDRYGHATGDEVLKAFGSCILGRLRVSDLVGRIGGEEFLIVLPETHAPDAVSVAEVLRTSVAAEKMRPVSRDEPFQITCCFGVAQLQNRDADGGSLLARADVALYRAKAMGRNRVESDS